MEIRRFPAFLGALKVQLRSCSMLRTTVFQHVHEIAMANVVYRDFVVKDLVRLEIHLTTTLLALMLAPRLLLYSPSRLDTRGYFNDQRRLDTSVRIPSVLRIARSPCLTYQSLHRPDLCYQSADQEEDLVAPYGRSC